MSSLRTVSLVIPGRNEAASVGALLSSVASQTEAPDEVIFVDAGSSDNTVEIVEQWRGIIPGLLIVRAGPAYPGEARNNGVAHARGEWIAFADCGTTLDHQWLESLLRQSAQVDVVFGNFEPVISTAFDEIAALAYVPAPGVTTTRGIRTPAVPSMLVRRTVFERVGGFPPFRAAEDLAFLDALHATGAGVATAPEANVFWQLAPDWQSTFRRFSLYSYHNVLGKRMRYWHFAVMRQHITVLLTLVLALPFTRAALLLPVVWLLARAIVTSRRKRRAFRNRSAMTPLKLVRLAVMLLIIDVAMWCGALAYWFDLATGRLTTKWAGRAE